MFWPLISSTSYILTVHYRSHSYWNLTFDTVFSRHNVEYVGSSSHRITPRSHSLIRQLTNYTLKIHGCIFEQYKCIPLKPNQMYPQPKVPLVKAQNVWSYSNTSRPEVKSKNRSQKRWPFNWLCANCLTSTKCTQTYDYVMLKWKIVVQDAHFLIPGLCKSLYMTKETLQRWLN